MNQTFFMACLAVLVGVLGGLGSLLLHYLIYIVNKLSFSYLRDLLSFMGPLYLPLIGGTGGLLVGLLTFLLAREAKGHGIPEVIYAVVQQGGRIRPRVSLVKALTSAITIGTGGSAGREGPIAQIGAALGSTVGQLLHLSEQRLVTLVACGAGAGIAATFNAPVGGTIFALEVILREFKPKTFCMVAISSVSATLISQIVLGDLPEFIVIPYQIVSPFEMFFYILLGAAAAFVSVLFIRVFCQIEDLFKKIHGVPSWVLPALGGISFGLIGFYIPETLGRGNQVIEQVLNGELNAAGFLALLCFLKIITTSLTLGSGGSGGVLFPSMFIGACLGGSFGSVFHSLVPALTAGSGAYAIVGMGALFAAANHAPVTAILMLFEMTKNYSIIMPLMLACVVAALLARSLEAESINTIKLVKRGVIISKGEDGVISNSSLTGRHPFSN
jgi:CIC family chloride channel protein